MPFREGSGKCATLGKIQGNVLFLEWWRRGVAEGRREGGRLLIPGIGAIVRLTCAMLGMGVGPSDAMVDIGLQGGGV